MFGFSSSDRLRIAIQREERVARVLDRVERLLETAERALTVYMLKGSGGGGGVGDLISGLLKREPPRTDKPGS